MVKVTKSLASRLVAGATVLSTSSVGSTRRVSGALALSVNCPPAGLAQRSSALLLRSCPRTLAAVFSTTAV